MNETMGFKRRRSCSSRRKKTCEAGSVQDRLVGGVGGGFIRRKRELSSLDGS